jgi:hypothetical protein
MAMPTVMVAPVTMHIVVVHIVVVHVVVMHVVMVHLVACHGLVHIWPRRVLRKSGGRQPERCCNGGDRKGRRKNLHQSSS